MHRSSRRKYHYIYKITRADGKYYIGLHSTDNLEDGYFGSGQVLRHSIKRHGKEVHTKEIIEFLPSRESLKHREAELVNEQCLGDPLCMNLKLGGEGGWEHLNTSDEVHKERCRSGGKIGAKTLNSSWWPNARLNPAVDTRFREICANAFRGRQHSEQTKQQMSQTKKTKQSGAGEKNSRFGTCWIFNEELKCNKSIPKDELEQFLSEGWKLGRKMNT